MGAYNVVTATLPCPGCNGSVPLRIQFKYGNTWQHEYKLGERLTWGGNDIGEPGHKRVVVDGIAESCPSCGYDETMDYYVFLRDDVIVSVEPATNEYDFARTGRTYIVLDEAGAAD